MNWSTIFVPGVDMSDAAWDLAERFGRCASRHRFLSDRAYERSSYATCRLHLEMSGLALATMDVLKLRYMQTVNLRLN